MESPTPTARGWQRLPSRAAAAVETVRLGSAGLSAAHYSALGLVVSPWAAAGLGLVAFATDYAKGTVLNTAMTKGNGLARRAAAWAVFAVLFLASMIAVDGVLMRLRSALVAGPAHVISAHDRASGEYRTAVAELEGLGTVRTPDAIRADMDAAPVSRAVFRKTGECTDITRDSSLEACRPLLALRTEMAVAIRKRELEAVRDAAKGKLEALGPRPAHSDPQAEVLASALEGYGVSPALVAYGMIAIVGLGIELVACFGLVILGKPSVPSIPAQAIPAILETATARPRTPPPLKGAKRGRKADQRVIDFSESFLRKHGRAPTGGEIKAAFPALPTSTVYDAATRFRATLTIVRAA